MFCKWCGLESETSDVCSWCRKPFSTAAAAQEQIAPSDTGPGNGNPPASATAFDDFDDLSPLPFGGAPAPIPATQPRPIFAPPPPGGTPAAQPPAPAIVPRTTSVPPPYVPPVSPGRSGPGYTPALPRQPVDDRPQLEPIPIRKPAVPGQPLPVIPIQRPSQPAAPPPSLTPSAQPPRTVIPLAGAPIPPPAVQTPPPAPLNAAPAPAAPPQPSPLIEPAPLEELDLPPLFDEPAEEFTPLAPAPGRRLDLDGVSAPPATQARPQPPPPPTFGRTATMAPPVPPAGPRQGARTYYCRWCGLESETADICSWCRRDLRNMPQGSGHHVVTTRHLAPPKRGPVRQAPVKPVAPPPKPAPAVPSPGSNGGHPAPAVPELGTFTAQKSKYYTDKVMDPVSGAHYDADTGEAQIDDVAPIETEETNLPVQLAINIGVLAAVAVIAGVAVHVQAGLYLAVLTVSNFAAGIAMPLLRTVPFGEDDSSDLPWFLGCTLLLGPFVGAIFYGVICFAKQDANPAIVGIFVSSLVIRVIATVSAGYDVRSILPFSFMEPRLQIWQVIVAQLMPLVAMAGWYAAGMFHKPDE